MNSDNGVDEDRKIAEDQLKELARLKDWIDRVAKRPRRQRICNIIGALIDRDALRYGFSRSATGIKKGYFLIAETSTIQDLFDSAYANDDMVGWGLIQGLVKRMILIETGYSRGKPDLIFLSLLCENVQPSSETHIN